MRILVILLPLSVAFLGACATPNDPEYAARERAECQRMEEGMGLGSPHDHHALHGMGQNSMNLSHERCVRVLKKAK